MIKPLSALAILRSGAVSHCWVLASLGYTSEQVKAITEVTDA